MEERNEEFTTLTMLLRATETCRYLQEKASALHIKLTGSGKDLSYAMEQAGMQQNTRERVMGAYLTAIEQIEVYKNIIRQQKYRICRKIKESEVLSDKEKKTLLMRLWQHKSIREIAVQSGISDAAVIKRIKVSGGKLIDKEHAERFYEILADLYTIETEGTHGKC